MSGPEKMLAEAICIASTAHMAQLDKAGRPYILHPIAVMLSMPEDDYDGRIVAILHDTVEDTPLSLDRIAEMFSEKIAIAVDAISKRVGETNRDYWTRCRENPIARRVKIKDMEHNASEARLACLSESEAEYLRGKYAKAREYFKDPA